jgi:hypothetical protein
MPHLIEGLGNVEECSIAWNQGLCVCVGLNGGFGRLWDTWNISYPLDMTDIHAVQFKPKQRHIQASIKIFVVMFITQCTAKCPLN